jgi:hypothetical protein
MPKIRKPQPKQGQHIKSPSTSDIISESHEYPVFCLRFLQQNYGIRDCQDEDRIAFASKLEILSKMRWQEIYQAPRHGLGSEKIAQESIKVSLPNFLTQETNLIALRFSGRKPMVGFREGNIFRILWLDHDFSLYDHG